MQIKNPIPDTPIGKSDKQSFDLQLDNIFYGQAVSITLPPPLPKRIEQVSVTLPQTGASAANVGIALFAAGALFIALRNKLIKHELAVLASLHEGIPS